jgi:hypothetical protein
MSILVDLFNAIVGLSQKSVTHAVVEFPNDREKRLVISATGVETLETPLVEPDRLDECLRLDDFCTAIANYSDSHVGEDPLRPDVYFDGLRVSCWFDGPFRVNGVTLGTPLHPQAITILELAKPKTFDQKSLVRLLRHDLAGAVDPAVLARVRTINWENKARVQANYQHANSALDSEVRASVAQSEAIPEQFVAHVKLFTLEELTAEEYAVVVTLDVDASTAQFTLTLLPGESDKLRLFRLNMLSRLLGSHLESHSVIAACTGK